MPTKVNRRDFLRTVALGTAGAIIAGCVPPVPVTVKETVVVEKPVEKVVEKTVVVEKVVGGLPVPRDQTVVLNESAIFRVFDAANPFAPNAMLTSGWDQLIAARLMYLNWATGESVNMLLVDDKPYEYNSDFTQITFHARKDAKWNDGVAFTAKDIKFTVEMLMGQPKLGWSATFNEWVDSVTCPDDYTAVFKLKKPGPRFHFLCFKQAWSCPIVAEHEWKGKDPVTYKAFPRAHLRVGGGLR